MRANWEMTAVNAITFQRIEFIHRHLLRQVRLFCPWPHLSELGFLRLGVRMPWIVELILKDERDNN